MKWLLFSLLSLTIWSAGCHQATTPPPPPAINPPLDTTLFMAPRQVGVIDGSALEEISGVAPSYKNPGYLWAEEDSGNPNQIQLISPQGATVGRFTLPALINRDWEDIATIRFKTGQSYIYLAEIGDNAAGRGNGMLHRLFNWTASKEIYRFPEPAITGRKLPVTESITAVETITLILPNGPRDAEAMLVDPVTSELYVLTKGWESEVYQATCPPSVTAPLAMRHGLTLPFRKVTSAAISPDGSEILIRTYKQLFYYERRHGESVMTALRHTPRQIPLASEPQGEAISWLLDGSGYYSTSEQLKKERQLIYFYQRKHR